MSSVFLLVDREMFAKLKKKIEEQGGSVADGEKFNSSANASTPLKGSVNYISVKRRGLY